MLSRNEFIHTSTTPVDTTKFEAMIHEMDINDMELPINYLIIFAYQRYYEELLANRIKLVASSNCKLERFGKYSLWTKNSDSNGKNRILGATGASSGAP